MKTFKSSLVLIFILFSFSKTIYASEITSTTVNEFTNNTAISGSLPTVTTSNASLTQAINDEVTNIYTTRANSAKNSNAKSITFSYDLYQSSDVTSIVITSRISKLKSVTYIDTIVYDNSQIYTLDNYLSSSSLKVFNKEINDLIKQSPENYKVSSVALNDKTPFYVTNSYVTVAFDGESISSATGITTFNYKNTVYDSYVLNKDNYYLQASTQVKYVPIRDVYSNLGYNVTYRNKKISVFDADDTLIATFDTEGTEKSVLYTSNTSFSSRNTTNYKALVYDSTAYAPLSVIQSTTGIVYDIHSNGDIVFPIIQ